MAQELIDKIRAQAQARGLDPDTAVRIAQVESSLNPTAQAKTSTAKGLFGVIDGTWKQFGGKPGQQKDPDENIRVGMNILESNRRSLRSVLGRDPSPTELYAAHFLGPEGAKGVLQASPDTPVSQLLSQRAIKANPTMLKDKNVGQLMAVLNQKMGGQPVAARPAKAAEPPARAPAAPEAQPDYEAIGRGQMTADLGPGYKAALALSFLSDEDEDGPYRDENPYDREERIAREGGTSAAQMLADYKPKNALADINWDESSLLAQPKMMADGGEVQKFAAGGVPYVPLAAIRPSLRAQLTQAATDNAEYSKAVDAYNAAAEAYNANPQGEFTMKEPTAPMTQAQYDALVAKTREDVRGRNLALQVAANPEQFGLSINKFFSDGGEVEAPILVKVPGYSETVARDMYPGQQGQFDQQDAARHMLASGTLARKYGPGMAEFLGQAHEVVTSPMRFIGSKLGISQMPVDYEQDLHNNRLGIELARRAKSQRELEDLVQAEAERAARSQAPGKAWIGRPERPVKRAEGSPSTGEVAGPTPEEIAAASRPAFLTPKSGIGRKTSTKPGEIEAAALQGVSETPYNLVGAPVDLATLVMRPFGYTNPAPVMGSEWIKQKMTAAGVRPAPPTQPTARAVYEAAQLGSSLVNPAAPVRGAVAAGQAAGRTARQAMQDFQAYNRALEAPGASYAVRARGTPFLMAYGEKQVDGKFPLMDEPEKYVQGFLANTQDYRLNEWFSKKVTPYLRRDFATTEDQFVKAADEGKLLHFVKKPSKRDAPEGFDDYDRRTSLEGVRKTEGFPPQGVATTPYGKRVETLVDESAWPLWLEDISSPGLVPPSLRGMEATNPSARVTELGNISEKMKFEELRDRMLDMREMGPTFSKYGQPPVKVPKEYMLSDESLIGLSPAQASQRAAQFENWKQDVQQKMASNAAFKDPNISRTPAADGHVWVNAPDLENNPTMRELIQDVGCDGGWCTRKEATAVSYGSGENRLTVLMNDRARPQAQMTITTKKPDPDDFLASMEPDEVDAFRANNPDVALYDMRSIMTTPEYREWQARNPGGVSVTEIKGVNNETDLVNTPYVKQIQQRIKDLDSQFSLQNVENLDGIGMTDLTSRLWGHPAIANRPMVNRANMQAIQQEATRLNGGSRFIEVDKQMIDSLIRQAADNILGPEGRATGGLIERRFDDSRKYL